MSNPNQPQDPGRIPQFTLGDRLRKARELSGLDMNGLASVVDIHRQSVARYENDQATPRRHVLLSWSVVTGVDLGWIETGATNVEQPVPSTDYGSKGIKGSFFRGIPRAPQLEGSTK